MEVSLQSDIELAARLNNGDKTAVEEVYLLYSDAMLTYAQTMLKEKALAEDTIADVFTWILNNLNKLHISTSLKSYLYRCVKNRVLNEFSRDQYRQKYISSMARIYTIGDYSTDQQVRVREVQRTVNETLETLPPKMREIYELSRKENLTRSEIARLTGKTESTVNNQINKVLNILRAKLYSWFF